jgi:hypothetical protein
MKKLIKNPYVSWGLRILIAVPASIVIYFMMFSGGINHHNSCIQDGINNSVEIQIKCKAITSLNTTPKTVSITDKDKIKWVLGRLRINQPFSLGLRVKHHACGGHLTIVIRAPNREYFLNYDHGNGIYPIDENEYDIGFIDLDQAVCSELNEYFLSLGFTKNDLGIH